MPQAAADAMTDNQPDQLTFTAAKAADPAAFHESQCRGAAATVEYWRKPRPPEWLVNMSAAEFIAWLERKEERNA